MEASWNPAMAYKPESSAVSPDSSGFVDNGDIHICSKEVENKIENGI